MIKSEVARAHLENNTAVIPAEFIVTASLRKCLKRTLSPSYLNTWNLQRNIFPRNFYRTIGDLLLVMTERLKLLSEIYSIAKVQAVLAVLIKI
jgi:hypothetical protein